MPQYFTCPVCGTDVPLRARACPECGSDRETGWSEEAQYIHLIPDRGDADRDSRPSTQQQSTWRQYVIPIGAVAGLCGVLMATGFRWLALLVPLAVVVVRLVLWRKKRVNTTVPGLERQAYQQLLRRAAGDRSLASRLIEFERQRTPEATRLQLIQNALSRWERDRR